MDTEYEELISFLRWRGKGDYSENCHMPPCPSSTKAADLIEALVAEVKRLREEN